MSVSCNINDFSKTQLSKIYKDLSISPIIITKIGKDRVKKKGNPILFYDTETCTEKNGDDVPVTINLPYNYANELLGKNKNLDDSENFVEANIEFKNSLRPYQEEYTAKALKILDNEGACILALYASFGKTVVAAYLSSQIKLVTVILMTREPLEKAWEATFVEFSPNSKIWKVDNKPPEQIPDIIICMERRTSKIPSAWIPKIGMLIIDEAHEFCSPARAKTLLTFKPGFIIACTATPHRADGTFEIIEKLCGKNSVVKISDKPFDVFKVETNISVNIKLNCRKEIDWSRVVLDLCADYQRNELIIHLVKVNLHRKILIMTPRIRHTEYLYEQLIKRGIECDFMASTKKSYNDSKVLIGTVSKIGTGFDEARACSDYKGVRSDVLIFACSTKSLILIEQVVGRVFRADNPTVYHLVDDVAPCKNHWNVAKKWYLSRNGAIKSYADTRSSE